MSGSLIKKTIKKQREDGTISLVKSMKWFVEKAITRQIASFRRSRYRFKYGPSYPDTYRLIFADPNDIEYYLLKSTSTDWSRGDTIDEEIAHLYRVDKGAFQRKKNINHIIDGDWDKKRRLWEENMLYQALKDVFIHGEDWESTEFVQNRLEVIEINGNTYGCQTKEDFLNNRIEYIEELYQSMSEKGYLTQEEAPEDHRNKDIFHEISVNIGRNGELIFNNRSGHHRLSLAKILDIDEIPLLVIVRHKQWQELRHEVYNANSVSELGPTTKKFLEHPDMKDVATSFG